MSFSSFCCAAAAGLLVLAAPVRAQYPASKHGGTYMFNYYLPPAPSTTPWWPSWSPDGKWIAVAMYGSIWKVDVSSGEAFELLAGKKYHSSPDWSPTARAAIRLGAESRSPRGR